MDQHYDLNSTFVEFDDEFIGDDGMIELSKALRRNTTVKKLYFKRSGIEREGAIALSKMLKTNTTITKLTLMNNRIKSYGMESLLTVLSYNKTLKTLRLKNNARIDISFMKLFSGCTLSKLELSISRITDDGATKLVSVLNGTTVTSLSLAGNFITDKGALALFEILQRNNTLIIFDITDNSINDIGFISRINNVLTELRISADEIEADSIVNVMTILKRNRTLKKLYIDSNTINLKKVDDTITRTIALTGMEIEIDWLNVTDQMVEDERIRIKNENAKKAAWALIIIWLRSRNYTLEMEETYEAMLEIFKNAPRDLFVLWAKAQWNSRDDDRWLFDPEDRNAIGAPSNSKRAKSCIGCLIGAPVFHEQDDPTRRFCSSYCQVMHHYKMPDFRGMTPVQIERKIKTQ